MFVVRTKWYNVAKTSKRQFSAVNEFAEMVPFSFAIMAKIRPYLSEDFNILESSPYFHSKYFWLPEVLLNSTNININEIQPPSLAYVNMENLDKTIQKTTTC